MKHESVFCLICVMLSLATVCHAQQDVYQTSDSYFGTAEVTIDTNGYPNHGDSAMLIVEPVDAYSWWKMIYYRERDSSDANQLAGLNDIISVPRIGGLSRRLTKYIVAPGLYTIALALKGPTDCPSWIRCSHMPLIPQSVVRLRVTAKYQTPDDEIGVPKFEFVETKLHSLRIVPSSQPGQSKTVLTLRVRDSLRVPYPFGAVLRTYRGSGASFVGETYLIDDTVTTLTLDPGEVELKLDSRFRTSATLQFPQSFKLGAGDSATIDMTLGGAHTIDSAALFGGYQRQDHFYGTTSVRHEPLEGASSRDSGILALEVVDVATQLPIPNAYAKVYETFCYEKWIVKNGSSSFAVPTGAYTVVCDPTGTEGCWSVGREGVLVLPGHRTIVRYEMNMKQSSP
jgi:hypothetical protein